MKKYVVVSVMSILVMVLLTSCQMNENNKEEVVRIEHVEWSYNANIYEVNIRQYTKEGTLNAFKHHLPRLREMGVDILWLMPVFPIGELNRKMSQTQLVEELEDKNERAKYLGSYYSTSDYYSINPEFGTIDDLKELVKEVHNMGMYIILDIAANHTAWDHPWVKSHPDYYTQVQLESTPWKKEWMIQRPEYYKRIRELGMTYPIFPNETDWWDVADLNYDNSGLRNEMLKVFEFWVEETDIDGYRCDVAGWVPCDFWKDVRVVIDSIKPVFMLAEDEDNLCLLEDSFDMNYSWKLLHIMNDIAKGEKKVKDLWEYLNWNSQTFSPEDYRMTFITNHDENSWNGTVKERMGDASKAFAVLTYTIPGMPLIYSGQEAGNEKALRFFEKDTINWDNIIYEDFYTELNKLKHDNKALWNGLNGGSIVNISTPEETGVFAFIREKDGNKVVVVINLSAKEQVFKTPNESALGSYKNVFSDEIIEVSKDTQFDLQAWSYVVLTN